MGTDGKSSTALELDPAFLDEDSDEFKALANVAAPDPEADIDSTETDVDGASSSAAGDTVTADDKAKAAAEAAEKAVDDGEETKGVSSKDGESVIPYKVLQEARSDGQMSREQLEQTQTQLDDAKRQIEELQQQVAAGGDAGKGGGDVDGETDKLVSTLASLKEDFPEFGEVAEALTTQVKGLQDELLELKTQRENEQLDSFKEHQKSAREIMDNNPHLVLWEAEDKEAYDRAFAHDQRLMKDPLFKDIPLKERFEKVVDLVKLEYPGAKVPSKEKVTQQQESNEELEAKAAQALKDAGELSPETLSDLPGGGLVDDAQSAKDLSPLQLEALFEGKSPEWIDEFITKHT